MEKCKRVLLLILAAAILLSLCSCSKSADDDEEERPAVSGYDTAKEAFLAYCEGLFTFDWEKIESAIHPDMMKSAYGREFEEYYYDTPEYAEKMTIVTNNFELRSEQFEDRNTDIDSFEKLLEEQCSVKLSVEELKYNKISFDTGYDGWNSFVFSDDHFVFKCDGKWYAFPQFKELTQDESEPEQDSVNEGAELVSVSVEDAYMKTIEADQYDSSAVHCYHIPKVVCSDADRFAAVNEKIYNEISPLTQGIVTDDGGAVMVEYLHYTWAIKGDIISILVEKAYTTSGYTDDYIYNISISSGEFASDDAVLREFGVSEAEHIEMVKTAITNFFEDSRENVINGSGADESYYNELLSDSIREVTPDSTVPFVCENGHLGSTGAFYWLAGAGWSVHRWDLTTMEFFWISECSTDHSAGTEYEPSEDVGSFFGAEGEAVEESAWQMLSHLEKNEGAKAAELLKQIYQSVQQLIAGTEVGYGYPVSEDCTIWNDPDMGTFLRIDTYDLDLYFEEPGIRVRFWQSLAIEPGSISYDRVCSYIMDFTDEWEFVGWSHQDVDNKTWYEYDSAGTLLDEWQYN